MLKENDVCRTLCVVPDVSGDEAKFINDRIHEDYAINWLIDGLPAAEMKVDTRDHELFFDMGFNLGDDEGKFKNLPAFNNHYEIVLRSAVYILIPVRSLTESTDTTDLRLTLTAWWEFSCGLKGKAVV